MEQIFIPSNYSFYDNLKFIINQADLIQREIFQKKSSNNYNGISAFESIISGKMVYFNSTLINFENTEQIEIQRRSQEVNIDLENLNSNERVIDLIFEYEQFTSVLEHQFIKWWEEKVKEKILMKYGEIRNASSICQFARQLRNAFGHSQINITANNCPDPVWLDLNLKTHNGRNIYELLSIADLINFWLEFEETELME